MAYALQTTVGHWFAERAVVALDIGNPDGLWQGVVPMVLGAVGGFVYGLPFAALLVQAPRLVAGRTAGGALVGAPARSFGRVRRFALETSPLLLFCGGLALERGWLCATAVPALVLASVVRWR